jgi:hypothetical protein
MSFTAATSATTACQYGGGAGTYTMVFECTVTDSVSGHAVSNTVTATIILSS